MKRNRKRSTKNGRGTMTARAGALALSAFLLGLTLPAGAAVVEVGTFDDFKRELLENNNSVELSGNIAVSKDLPVDIKSKGLVIDGQGNKIIWTGADKSNAGLITLGTDATTLTLKDITITSMDQSGAYGSVIFRSGALSLDISGEVTLENNKSLSSGSTLGFGGAIYSGGNLVISGEGAHLILSGNVASSEEKRVFGGAIYSGGVVAITAKSLDIVDNQVTTPIDMARGGAIYSGTTVSIIATQWLNIQGNHATGGNVLGGAIYSGGVVTIIAKSIDVTGNKATASGNAQGGAIYSTKGDITLSGGSILFEAQSGGVYAASGGISVLAGELSAAAGVNFSAPKGTFSMADGTALTVDGVASSADATADKLFSVTAPYIAFGDPEKETSSVVLTVDGEAEKDLYFLIYSGSIITSGKENYGFDLSKYEKATVRNAAVEGGSALVLIYSNPEETYTWLGTSGGAGVWDYDDANTSV